MIKVEPSKKNRRVFVMVLCMVLAAVIFDHVAWKRTENGPLLVVDGKEFDALGALSELWNSSSRDCRMTSQLAPKDAVYGQAEEQIKLYSPPQSRTTHVASAWMQGPWILMELEFDDLLPAVVLLKRTDQSLSIVEQAVWSGYTSPWKAAPYIRAYILSKAPEMPQELIQCFQPHSAAFQ
jgi:hypothetical protein